MVRRNVAKTIAPAAAHAATLDDNLSGYPTGCWNEASNQRSWRDELNGYGKQCIVKAGSAKYLRQAPAASTSTTSSAFARYSLIASGHRRSRLPWCARFGGCER
jgi:hypothetical protein